MVPEDTGWMIDIGVMTTLAQNDPKCNGQPATKAEVGVNGTLKNICVDSGSPKTLMSKHFAVRRGLEIRSTTDKGRYFAAGGERLRQVGEVEVTMLFGKVEIRKVIVVIEGLIQDLLIGTDMMLSYGFIVDYRRKTLSIEDEQKNTAVVDIKVVGDEEIWPVCCTEQIVVPARSEIVVKLEVPMQGLVMLTRREECVLEVAEGVYKRNKEGRVNVLVRNTKNRAISIDKGKKLADVTMIGIEGYIVNGGERQVVSSIVSRNEEKGISEDAVIDRKNMSEAVVKQYERLIDEFKGVFSKDDQDIGCSRFAHDIKLTDDTPFKARAYRIPIAQAEIVENQVKAMLEMGVISKSSSPYASPVVLVKKSDGTIRFCVDYRKLNNKTIKDNYPMPLIEERLDSIFGSKVFSGLDLTSGYWQFAMSATAKEFTAFICHLGLYEFERMPFGLCNAGASFQRVMETVLNGLAFAMAYIDDILVHSVNHEDHLKHLRIVFTRLSEAGLKCKLKKCTFGFLETRFLGYVVSEKGIKMNSEKIDKIVNYPIPVSAKQMKKFNGLSSYFRDFIPNYTMVNEPLQKAALKSLKDPTTKERVVVAFKWTEECQQAFDKLKRIIAAEPILVHPDMSKLFRLITDASIVGLGAVLVQPNEKGIEMVVSFAARTLNEAERNYTTGERELLAIKWSVRKFRCYLYGRHFEVITDHKPLIHVKTAKNPSERSLKWILELEEYDIAFRHRPGKLNVIADVLSRIDEPPDEPIEWYHRNKSISHLKEEIAKTMTVNGGMFDESDEEEEQVMCVGSIQSDCIDKAKLTKAQNEDSEILEMLNENAGSKGVFFRRDKEGTVFMVDPKRKFWRIVVPRRFRRYVLEACHDSLGGGHMGRTKTLGKIASRFYWNGMSTDCARYVDGCETCNKTKSSRRPSAPLLISLPRVNNPFDRVAIDFVGPLPTTAKGNRYILVLVDYATRWPEAFATKDMLATTVAEILVKEILCRHGAPVELLSDQGRDFLANVVKEVCVFTKTKKIQTAAYHPQTNGLCERFNGTLTQILSAYVHDNQRDWDNLLPIALFGYRIAIQESTKRSPAELLYGRQIRLPLNWDLFLPKLEFSRQLKDEWRRAQESVSKVADKNRMYQSQKNKPIDFTECKQIRVRNETTKPGMSRKLSIHWSEPLEVLEVKGNNIKIVDGKGNEKWINQERAKKVESPIDF